MNNLAFQIYGSTKSGIFQSTWKTDNAGVSSSTQIELPLLSGGTYNFWIDWGDGSTTNVTSYSQRTHTYASAGTYTLRATGAVGIWRFGTGTTNDKLKILTISNWGKLILGPTAFYGCSNLTLSGITDVPNLTGVTDLTDTFSFCPLITTIGRLNEWDMSTITTMQSMFYTSGNFNQYIGDWNVSNVTNMATMFWATPFNNGYASGVAGSLNWNTVKVTTFSNMFAYNTGFNQDISAWNVNKVTSFGNMFLRCITFNNGNNTNVNPITLRPGIDGWDLNTTSDVALDGWMNSNGGPMIFNRNLNNWNTVKVINMRSMFENCGSFNNGYASGVANQLTWNTSSCTNMSLMFKSAPAFNSNLGTGTTPWDVSKVTTFGAMFNGATNFNNGDDAAPINNWSINTVSNVSMGQMFQSTNFNRYIGDWNVSKVTTMGNMFLSNTSFNQDLSKWNMSSVTSTEAMFFNTNAFTNGSNTNTNPITGLTGINGWNINTTTSVNMTSMFAQNTVFNQPIGSWDVSKVTNMSAMFYNASAFNQPIGSWDVSIVTNFSNFMYGKTPSTYSSTNLDAIYNGWSALPSIQPNLTNVSFGTAKYTSAGTAGRLTLTSAPNNWIIQDGGL